MFETVKNDDFMILSVAMDADVEAARPWIEAAAPGYITLIDQNHLLSSCTAWSTYPRRSG